MKEMQEGFPLKPFDSNRNLIKERDLILIRKMPKTALSAYLSEKQVSDVMSCEGIKLKIKEMDEYGFVWVEKTLLNIDSKYQTHSFCIEPEHVTKIEDNI